MTKYIQPTVSEKLCHRRVREPDTKKHRSTTSEQVNIIDLTSPAAATATLANDPSQGELVDCLSSMNKYQKHIYEQKKEWDPLKAELKENEKSEEEKTRAEKGNRSGPRDTG